MASAKARISELTRRDITDFIAAEGISWCGRLREIDFLSRLYDLQSLPSTDSRFRTAERDIIQHREHNYDWDDDWVFGDGRFRLRHGPDEVFVAFLAEMVHPVVRDKPQVADLLDHFNTLLRRDGWELIEVKQMSGRPVFAGRRITGHRAATDALQLDRYPRVVDEEAIREHMRRIDAGLVADPAAAVASSKELVETTCKMILEDFSVEYRRRDDLADLFKKTTTALALRPQDIAEDSRGSDAAKKTLRAMVPLVQGLAELRNEFGLGHGRARSASVPARYGRLAFNASVTLVEFLLETWHVRKAQRDAA